MNNHEAKVREFHMRARQPVENKPTIPDGPTRALRAKLILEEALETIDALGVAVCAKTKDVPDDDEFTIGAGSIPYLEFRPLCRYDSDNPCFDIIKVADGCADLKVVVTGTQLACGIPIDETQDAVDESNLAKFEGDYKIREDGKLIKPSDWKEPDIEGILRKNGWEG